MSSYKIQSSSFNFPHRSYPALPYRPHKKINRLKLAAVQKKKKKKLKLAGQGSIVHPNHHRHCYILFFLFSLTRHRHTSNPPSIYRNLCTHTSTFLCLQSFRLHQFSLRTRTKHHRLQLLLATIVRARETPKQETMPTRNQNAIIYSSFSPIVSLELIQGSL